MLGTIFCAVSLDGWLGPEVSSFGFFLVVLFPLGLLWLAAPLLVSLSGIYVGLAPGARWRVIAAWTGLACLGFALDIALWRATVGSVPGVSVPSWGKLLPIGYALAGLAMIGLLGRMGRDRLPFPAPEFVWRHARNAGLAFAGALPILAVSVPSFIGAEIRDLGSVHRVDAGATVAMRLEPGRHDLDVNQDPAGEYYVSPFDFSVAGDEGRVAVHEVAASSASDWGQMFLDVGNTTPAAYFTTTEPGTYRVSLAPNNADIVYEALVSDPSGAVLARTAPWAAGMLAALGVMVVCWSRIRRAQRAALLPGAAGAPLPPR